MKRIVFVTGSRADIGLLQWPYLVLSEMFICMWSSGLNYSGADCVLLLGDRHEILRAALNAHLERIPIAHLCGGDTTEGSYDDAMRDCISRLARWHFVTSEAAETRLARIGITENVHLVGSTAMDYIMHGDWKRERPFPEPYVVVSYQAETIDGTDEIVPLLDSLPNKFQVFFYPNMDMGSDRIRRAIKAHIACRPDRIAYESLSHAEFLNLLYHADEFIGNSSAMLYEAPALGMKCRMIGKRQKGRVVPWGDGKASERIRDILKAEL